MVSGYTVISAGPAVALVILVSLGDVVVVLELGVVVLLVVTVLLVVDFGFRSFLLRWRGSRGRRGRGEVRRGMFLAKRKN